MDSVRIFSLALLAAGGSALAAILVSAKPGCSWARGPVLAPASAVSPGDAGIGSGEHGFIVLPTRVVFEGNARTAAVTLVNKGSVSAAYRIGFVQMRMSESGEIRPITAPKSGEAFADTLVRYAPRQVELRPQESRTIRLQLRKPADLPPGEFRSHLLVQEVPRTVVEEGPLAVAGNDPVGVQVHMTSLFGIAIPVIVREGTTSALVTFPDVRVSRGRNIGEPATAIVEMRRDGSRSVYGDLTLFYLADNGRRKVVGIARGIGIYTPNHRRLVHVPVMLPQNSNLVTGRLVARFTETTRRAPVLAEASFILP